MMLKNLMEDKQLDFNQPLLSVRRFSSPAAPPEADNKRKTDKPLPKLPPLPVYKSELKSGPIRNPGTVPFVWERTPGKPKDEEKSRPQAPVQPPIAPKFPPGRRLNVRQEVSDKGSNGTNATQSQTRSILSSSRDASDLDKRSTTEDKISKQGTEEKSSFGSEDGDEAYQDALDTLSRSESFFLNCSVSGVSGLDGPNVKPSGTFSTDPQTRDFMMGRFLPAAKAMASETLQHAPRKPQVVREQPRPVSKVVNQNMRHPVNQYKSNGLPPYAQELGAELSEDESEYYEGSDMLSAKVCGLFPRFCLKSSFCLLNPVPGMKMPSQFPVSSVRRVQANSSSASSCSETKMEHAEDFVYRQRSTVREQKTRLNESKIELKHKSNEIEEKSYSRKLDQSTLYGHQQGNGLSSYHSGYSQSKLPEQKGFLGLPEKKKNSIGRGFDINKSRRGNFQEFLNNEGTKWEVGSRSPVVEKTLYVDSVHTVKSPSPDSSSSDMKCFTDCRGNDVEIPEKSNDMEDARSVDSSLKDIKHLSVMDEKETASPKSLESVDPSFLPCFGKSTIEKQMVMTHDSLALMSSKGDDHENLVLESQRFKKSCDQEKFHDLTRDSITSTGSKISVNKIDLKNRQHLGLDDRESCHGQLKMTGGRKIDPEIEQLMKSGSKESSLALVQSSATKVAHDRMIDLESQRLGKLGNQESSQGSNLQMPLALLLPKSPSESWLKRTLPTVSARNLSSWSSLAARIGSSSPMASPLDPKWETIVKTSIVQHGRLRFSEEHLSPIPEA